MPLPELEHSKTETLATKWPGQTIQLQNGDAGEVDSRTDTLGGSRWDKTLATKWLAQATFYKM